MILPNLTIDFINFLNTKNLKDKILTEFGAGYSTLYFSDKFKQIISFDNERKTIDKIECLNIKNLKIQTFKEDKIINSIKNTDYILIDTNPKIVPREDLVKYALNYAKNDCQIILDNGTWNINAYNMLKDNYFCLDFPGKNMENELTVTSLFFKKITKEYFL